MWHNEIKLIYATYNLFLGYEFSVWSPGWLQTNRLLLLLFCAQPDILYDVWPLLTAFLPSPHKQLIALLCSVTHFLIRVVDECP